MGADEPSEHQDAHEPYGEGDVRLAFGRRPDGRIVHVSETTSGVACGCTCPACRVPLVAKRGEIKEDHFAHHVVGTCRHARETALHMFAKQLLEETRRIVIPEIRATFGGRSKVWQQRRDYKFDDVALELRLGDIVPDVVLRKGGRELLVEIFVTHRCDARKRERIRDLGISAMEVDLSAVNFTNKAEIAEAIYRTASREWLFNPLIDQLAAELRQEEEQEAERARLDEERRINRLRQSILGAKSRPSSAPCPIDLLKRVRRKGLEAGLGIDLAGDFCFAVGRVHWQAVLLDRCVSPLDQPAPRWSYRGPLSFRTKDAFEKVRSLLRPSLDVFINEETETRLRVAEADFVRPYMVVVAYLEALQERGILTETSFGWSASGSLEKSWDAVRRRQDEKTRRTGAVLDMARAILARLPEREKKEFDLAQWFRRFQPSFGCSFATCVANSDPRFDEMEKALTAVRTMVDGYGAVVENLLGLPLEGEVRRQEEAREAERQERALREAHAEVERVRQITQFSEERLGSSLWAETPNPSLGGAAPRDFVRENSDRLNQAIRAAAFEERRRQEKIEAAERRAALAATTRSQLVDAVRRKMSEERANLFLRSAHPKLGRQRPIDYCIDEETLRTCLLLLEGRSLRV